MQEMQNRHKNHLEVSFPLSHSPHLTFDRDEMRLSLLFLLQDKYRQEQTFKRPDDHPQLQQQSAVSSQPLQPPPPMPPLLSTPRDRGPSEISETMLCGEPISCFSVGGEFRLCLPQILNTVLDSVSLHAIHQGCDELQIYCSTCSPTQLEALKARKILPITAYQARRGASGRSAFVHLAATAAIFFKGRGEG